MYLFPVFTAAQDITDRNITVLFGPFHHFLAAVAEKTGIPYFLTGGADLLPYGHVIHNVFNVMPDISDRIEVITDTLNEFRWTEVAVFYDGETGKWAIPRDI